MKGSIEHIHIPEAWKRLDLENLGGVLLVVGPPDSGKTTFARYLHAQLSGACPAESGCIALIDGDPGQSSLGPPASLTLVFAQEDAGLAAARSRRVFLGSVTPRGHMLTALVGAARLVGAALEAGSRAVVYDTSGLVEASQGGVALKQAKIDLLRPRVLFALQKKNELEPLLLPLRRTRRVEVIDLVPSPEARSRDSEERRRRRQSRFSTYFQTAHSLEVDWSSLAVFPLPRFSMNRLVAFEDDQGFVIELGIVIGVDRQKRKVTILTPLPAMQQVNAIRLGSLAVDPHSFRDSQLAH